MRDGVKKERKELRRDSLTILREGRRKVFRIEG